MPLRILNKMKSIMNVNMFMCDRTPYACWDPNLREKNIDFLNGINPEYYFDVASNYINKLDNDNKYSAALSIRLAYSNALETLFSLLCATIQAHSCPLGWVLCYRNSELMNVVKKISQGKEVYSYLKMKKITWIDLSRMINNYEEFDNELRDLIQKGFGKFWMDQADILLNNNFTKEYNGIKHGLRVEARKGFGFKLKKIDNNKGINNSISFDSSKFGSKFYYKKNFVEKDKETQHSKINKINFQAVKCTTNWDPFEMAKGLKLIYMSINNILVFLKKINGVDNKGLSIIIPNNKDEFNIQIYEIDTVTNLSNYFELDNIEKLFTKDDIINSYF